jgi:ATP-dependent DNA helicase DinG
MPNLRAPSTLLTDTSFGVVPSVRGPQVELASRVARALSDDTGLAAEAGTGVGKTLAYAGQAVEFLLGQRLVEPYVNARGEFVEDQVLVDGERWARSTAPTGQRSVIVIATATKALQAQIVEQELPRLAAGVVRRMQAVGAHQQEIDVALRKIRFAKKVGKKNHLCFRRVSQMARRSPEVMRSLPIYQEFTDTVPGWIIADADEDMGLPADAWRFGVGYCNPDKCAYQDACSKNGYLKAKEDAEGARILVTNHALVSADLLLRRRELRATLPERMTAVILDEAHKFPDTLRESLTVTFSAGLWMTLVQNYAQLRFELDVAANSFPTTLPGIARVRGACEAFLRDRRDEPSDTANEYARALDAALDEVLHITHADELADLQKRAASASEHTPYGAFLKEMSSYGAGLNLHHGALSLLSDEVQMKGRYVLSTEPSQTTGEPPTRSLVPIVLASAWGAYLDHAGATPIYVSATLATGTTAETAFAPFLIEMGKTHLGRQVDTFLADSPFDYATQAVLYVPEGVDPKGKDRAAYAKELVETTTPLLLANEGHAFILFTSRLDLEAYEAALGESRYPYPVLSQCSSERVRTRGAALFKQTPNATLLGLRTFFEGVDVPGLGLSLVIIPKLPFASPSAVLEAKRSRYDTGYTGFKAVDIPIMLTDLRQMAGRLIRSTSDRGVVAVLDPRLGTKAYGRSVVEALGFPTKRAKEDTVVAYLKKIAERRTAETPAPAPRTKSSDPFTAAIAGDA